MEQMEQMEQMVEQMEQGPQLYKFCILFTSFYDLQFNCGLQVRLVEVKLDLSRSADIAIRIIREGMAAMAVRYHFSGKTNMTLRQ